MAGHYRHGSFRRKIEDQIPSVFFDPDLDFASIKIAKGIEARSYLRDGFVFCEDRNGKIIEIQILNLSQLKILRKKAA
ncbi:MAG: hypothetical protein HY072_04645 [Deltaproteobacteria bacterium]|nr:hypothetical protein [Deltaproteobacteria bacterium]